MVQVDQVIEDIERALKMEKLPPRQPPQPPQPQPQPQPPPPGEIARLFHSLKQLAQKEEEKASIDPKDKVSLTNVKNSNIETCYLVLLCFSYPCILWV